MGRHLQVMIDMARKSELEGLQYLCPNPWPADEADRLGRRLPYAWQGDRISRLPPIRFHRGWSIYVANLAFDTAVSRELRAGSGGFTGWTGQCLRSLHAAKTHGAEAVGVVCSNTHPRHQARQFRLAVSRHPIEPNWLHPALARRMVAEYEAADVVFVVSDHQRATFAEHGVPDEKMVKVTLEADARFRPRPTPPAGPTFNVCYIGGLTVEKGIFVLVDAFRKVAKPNWTLTLQGAYASWPVRKILERTVARDQRIRIVGYSDPMSTLEASHVLVHPSFDDCFPLSVLEALAVGVPVLITDQTGTKERIREGVNGFVVETGSADAIAERLRALDRAV